MDENAVNTKFCLIPMLPFRNLKKKKSKQKKAILLFCNFKKKLFDQRPQTVSESSEGDDIYKKTYRAIN